MTGLTDIAEALRRTIIRRALEDILKFDDDAAFIAAAKRRLLEFPEPNFSKGAPNHDDHSRLPASLRAEDR